MTAPDINTPSPDDGHEALRLAMVAAIARVEERAADMYAALQALDQRVTALEAAARPDPEV